MAPGVGMAARERSPGSGVARLSAPYTDPSNKSRDQAHRVAWQNLLHGERREQTPRRVRSRFRSLDDAGHHLGVVGIHARRALARSPRQRIETFTAENPRRRDPHRFLG